MFTRLPTIPCRENMLDYERLHHKQLLVAKWLSLMDTNKVVATRELLDQLHMIDVAWSDMHHTETSNLSRTRHTTLATLELGHTSHCIYQRGFWGSLGMCRGFPWNHPSIQLNMRSVVRHGKSGKNSGGGGRDYLTWAPWAYTMYYLPSVMSIPIHTWFHHRNESYYIVLYNILKF